MTSGSGERSVHAGNISGSNVVTGDHNKVSLKQIDLPPPHTVDPKAELGALRELLAGLHTPERGKLDRAMQDAEEEAAKPKPDKEEIGGAVQRVLKAAKGANNFAEQVEKLTPRVKALAAWVGPAGHSLLSLLGLSA